MSDRKHYVYRAFDEFGFLLYIGCTKQPEVRWQQHKAEQRPWTQYAQRFVLSGPYEQATAFAMERDAIESERPYFNALSDERGLPTRRSAEFRRRRVQLLCARPDLSGAQYGTPEWDEFAAALDEIHAGLDATHPVITGDERHARYLNDVMDRKERAA